MSWPWRIAAGWLLLSIIAGFVVGPWLKRRRLELEAQEQWNELKRAHGQPYVLRTKGEK